MALREGIKISLKAARINAGMTQVEAAKHAGITVGTLQNWENGKGTPKAVELIGLAEIYKVPANAIFFARGAHKKLEERSKEDALIHWSKRSS